jgi:hypothetical protein
MSDIERKLDMILSKIEEIDIRLRKIENDTTDIARHVPFVDWLSEQAELVKQYYNRIANANDNKPLQITR